MRELISSIRNFPKHFGSAIYNLFRNGTMSIYSIIAVTVTLGIMGIIGVVAANVQNMTINIENSLSIYVKLDREITEEQALQVGEQIKLIDGIATISYSGKEKELDKMIDYFGEDAQNLFTDLQGDKNPLAGSYTVEVKDANDLESITKQIDEIEFVNKANYGGASTATLVKILEKVRDYGSIFVLGLSVVVVLLISSTIHMTIENRSSEVEIMRMVGASNWYIRIPFMIEGALIGLIGSIIPIIGIYIGYTNVYDSLKGRLMAEMLMLVPPEKLMAYSVILAVIGTVVGLFGSAFAIRKYLKK